MIERGNATEDEMVLAFLKAEIDSARFGPDCRKALSKYGQTRKKLIDKPDLNNTLDNEVRAAVLEDTRGYSANVALFRGFPENVTWRHVGLLPTEYGLLKYAKYNAWCNLSGGSRLVVVGAKNIETVQVGEDINAHVQAIAERIRKGDAFPELIAVQGNEPDLILLEGSKRATAYALCEYAGTLELLVGYSPQMKGWPFY